MKRQILLLATLLGSMFIINACGSLNETPTIQIEQKKYDKTITKDIVSVEEATQIIKENEGNTQFVLLDVRTNAEYNEGHLKNSVQHDYHSSDFNEWISKLDKEKRYLIYCRTDNRSAEAFNKLKLANFKYIQYIKGGYTEWADKGYPVEKPKYNKVLDVYITADKIKTKGSINFNFRVTDLDDNPIRNAKLYLKVVLNNNEVIKTDINMDDRGSETHSLDVQDWANGKYRLICIPEKKNYKAISAYYDFEVAEQDEIVDGNSKEITIEGDLKAEIVNKFYNRNIYGYKVSNRTQKLVMLGDSVASGPALLFFYFAFLHRLHEKSKRITWI